MSKEKCSRHVQVRIGVVLGSVQGKALQIGKGRGFLPIIRLPFCLGLGGIIGSGKQFLPWIHIDDMVIYSFELQISFRDFFIIYCYLFRYILFYGAGECNYLFYLQQRHEGNLQWSIARNCNK